jgi:hypothetical protein
MIVKTVLQVFLIGVTGYYHRNSNNINNLLASANIFAFGSALAFLLSKANLTLASDLMGVMAYCSITTPFKLPNQFELFKSKILSSKTKSQSKFHENFILLKD